MKLSNISWNFAGLAAPLCVAALAIPELIRLIGLERFGLLALAWGTIGYAGVFDLGIGRATTQLIASLRGQKAHADISAVLSVAARLTFIAGGAGLVVLLLAALFGIQRFIRHSPGLEHQLTASVCILAFAIPVQAISATYRGVNEAFENFRGISIVRMVLGVFNFLGPLLVAQFTDNVAWLISTLLVSRVLALALFRHLALQCVRLHSGCVPCPTPGINAADIRKRLFTFGGWFTVSSIINPLLMQADRFAIASIVSATAVAAYAIPYEIVVQSLIIVGAVTTVAFPNITKLMHEKPGEWGGVFRRWLGLVAGIMFIVAAAIAVLLPVVLPLWIGERLPGESVRIGQILCCGIVMNSIGSMYVAVLHSRGRSDITAQFHLLELPFFIAALYVLVHRFGLYGAAWAWVARVTADTVLLYAAYRRVRD